ncbi:MAG: alpha/beta hydrolase, partial [Proteobacteria bacterium]|nr:alpha/beta hydrolase [Pseudomonadota bacterium]
IPGGNATAVGSGPFIENNVTTDPVRFARAAAALEAEPALGVGSPTVAWVDAAFRAMAEFAAPAYAARIRQPILIAAAGRDQIVSTPMIERFAHDLRAGARLIIAGSRHEMLMEQDHYRAQFLAAFDAFVPGTPLY